MPCRIFNFILAALFLAGCTGYGGWYTRVKNENNRRTIKLVDWCKPGMRVAVSPNEWTILRSGNEHAEEDARILKIYPEYGVKNITILLQMAGCSVISDIGREEALKELRLLASGVTTSESEKKPGQFKGADYVAVVSGILTRADHLSVNGDAFRRKDGSGLSTETFSVQVIDVATGLTAFTRVQTIKYEEERVAKELAANGPVINW